MNIKSFICIVSLCGFIGAQSSSSEAQTIQIQSTVKGKTPTYLGFNPGESGGYEDGRHWGDVNKHGTLAFWLKQCGANVMRGWGRTPNDEGVWDSPTNRNDTSGDGETSPSGDGVNTQTAFSNARNAVIANPLGNSYINWNYFEKTKFITSNGMIELKSMGVMPVVVLRYKHTGTETFPTYMGGHGVTSCGVVNNPGLCTWEYKWEWWEYCFAMSYLWAKYTGATHFEIGNEPEYGSQGGLSIDHQINAINYCYDAVRAGVKAATGQTAVVMACGTNSSEYAQAMAGLTGKLDAVSVHAYSDQGNVEHIKTMLSVTGSFPIYNTENRGGALSAPYTLASDMFGYLQLANTRLNSVMFFLFNGSATGENSMLEYTSKVGLFKPRAGYYALRLLFRAGQNRKDVYNATSSDPSLQPLITKDASFTYITIHNTGSTSKTYSIGLPSWLTGTRQHVFLYDGGSNLDEPWSGVSGSGTTLSVSSQPAKSMVQIVYGSAGYPTQPVQYDETLYSLGQLSQAYPASTVGSVVTSFSDDFNATPDMDWAPTSKWICRAYNAGVVADGKDSAKALVYNNRLYPGNADQNPPAEGVRILWHANQVSIKSSPVVISTDVGYGNSNGNDDPKMGIIYRDNNGNLIGIRAFPNVSNGKFVCYRFSNPATPELIFSASSSSYPNNVLSLGTNLSLMQSQTVRVTISMSTIRVQVYDSNKTLVGDSGEKAHAWTFTGTGRIGIGKQKTQPLWYDNFSFTTGSTSSNLAPFSSISNPASGTTYTAPATVTINASATDSDGSVTRVEFFNGSSLLSTDTTSPYAATWGGVGAGAYTLTAKATDNGGASTTSAGVNITVNGTSSGTVGTSTLVTVADTFVRDGTYATSAYGTSTTLETKLGNAGYSRQTFLRFDVSGVSGTITSAKLRLYGKASQSTGVTATHAYGVTSDTWSESSTTWNTKPATSGSSLSSVSISSATAQYYEWDVTSFVQSEKAAGQVLVSLALKHDLTCSPNNNFNSREASSNKPQLVVTTQ